MTIRNTARTFGSVPAVARINGDDGFDDRRTLVKPRGPVFLGKDGRPEALTLYDLRRKGELLELKGETDFELLMSWLKSRSSDASHDEIFELARKFKRRLDAGESVELPGIVPELDGNGALEDQARAYLEATLGDGWKTLPPSVQASAIASLLAEVEAAKQAPSTQVDNESDDEQVGAFTMAMRRLEATSASFRGLTLEKKIKDPRVREEANRIELRRAERAQSNERALSDEEEVHVDSAELWNVQSVAELSPYPPARGVQSLVGKAITLMCERQPSFASHDWLEQVRQATALVSSLQKRTSGARSGAR